MNDKIITDYHVFNSKMLVVIASGEKGYGVPTLLTAGSRNHFIPILIVSANERIPG